MSRILVVDDDAAIRRTLELQLGAHGHDVRACATAAEAAERAGKWDPAVALVDLRLPDGDGLSVMREISGCVPTCAVVIITGTQDMQATIEAIRQGAFDYLRKPLSIDDVLLVIEKATVRGPGVEPPQAVVTLSDRDLPAREIVGKDRGILEVIKQVGLLSENRITVLIVGETGTGKELVARAIHEAGSPGKPFLPLNCSTIVPTLLESELFGHEKDAFTGAHAQKKGMLELAADGTVFFDEIGDMPIDLQAKLLRALQEREFYRVGGVEPVSFGARVLAATRQDLAALIAEGRFREDLYYRLSVATISVPPLRERRGDIPLLVEHLLGKINRELGKAVHRAPESLLAQFQDHDWPGNVRELENVLTRAVAMSRGDVLDTEGMQFPPSPPKPEAASETEIKTLQEMERDHIQMALDRTDWNITQTARRLGISPPTLRKKIRDYGLDRTA